QFVPVSAALPNAENTISRSCSPYYAAVCTGASSANLPKEENDLPRLLKPSSWLLVALLLVAFSFVAQAAPLKVGITQIVEHPALDKSRQGFIDRLTELGYVEGTDIVYDIQSAQGDMATAQTIARKFQSDGVDLVLAIATPTAQAAAHVIKDTP